MQERFEVDIKELPEQIDTTTYSKTTLLWSGFMDWLLALLFFGLDIDMTEDLTRFISWFAVPS